jgi:hypothetical protein
VELGEVGVRGEEGEGGGFEGVGWRREGMERGINWRSNIGRHWSP